MRDRNCSVPNEQKKKKKFALTANRVEYTYIVYTYVCKPLYSGEEATSNKSLSHMLELDITGFNWKEKRGSNKFLSKNALISFHVFISTVFNICLIIK